MLMNQNSRILVNIIGIPLVIFSIYVGGLFFNILVSITILLGTKEFINLSKKMELKYLVDYYF